MLEPQPDEQNLRANRGKFRTKSGEGYFLREREPTPEEREGWELDNWKKRRGRQLQITREQFDGFLFGIVVSFIIASAFFLSTNGWKIHTVSFGLGALALYAVHWLLALWNKRPAGFLRRKKKP